MDSRLAEWVGWLDTTKWSVFVLDRNRTVVWASEAFKDFLRERDDATVGVGKHIIEAIASPLWLSILSPDSVSMLADTALPYFLPENPEARAELGQRLVEPIRSAVAAIPRRDEPDLWSGGYEYLPGPGLAPLRTNYLVFRLREPGGEVLGSCVVSMLALRPALLSLLARGDEGMYERMASLVTPARHQTAILFADLQGSGDISRRMPTTHYFDLISRFHDSLRRRRRCQCRHRREARRRRLDGVLPRR